MSASEASRIKAPRGGKPGIFYRGDSRSPLEVFNSGFTPRGHDTSLEHHLSFAGESGLVSLTRSPQTAEAYAFGRTGEKQTKGYIYIVAPKGVPEGYWVPAAYSPERNPAVRFNQEFAVNGAIPGSSVSHAYVIYSDNPSDRSRKIKNGNYALRQSPGCVHLGIDGSVCDPAKFVDGGRAKAKSPNGTTKDSVSSRLREPPAGGKTKSSMEIWRPQMKTSIRIKMAGRVGLMAAVQVLTPYAHDLLDRMKEWDHPIGHTVAWFDQAIGDIQEAIGGKQVPEIHGNELKLRFICWLRGEQAFPNSVDRACQRQREQSAARTRQDKERDWVKGINQLLNTCDDAFMEPPVDVDLWHDLLHRCEALYDKALTLNEARTQLIDHREQVQRKMNAGGRVEDEDIEQAAVYITNGAFPSLTAMNSAEVMKLAAWYMGDMKPETLLDVESEGNETTTAVRQPAWAVTGQVVAGDIPRDEAVTTKMRRLVNRVPYIGLLQVTSLRGSEPCYSAEGLAEVRPSNNWDRVSAALVYIEQKLAREKQQQQQQACKACQRWGEIWVLACGWTTT
ncbi:Bordetella pertussis toxin A [Metarhizium rileyi]|uniref:Bordetella pertussis toxin A n=1 Tax=Metarhizium rileyi (strain RCEF 4871) TaxID=1649241 RepID=A0A166YFJ2_METRR|nr:Bordetella pertussis toxin A [Metarhizium rileyi RCEF 4871]